MEIEMGDVIITLVDKKTYWGDDAFTVPKGSYGLVCETYEDGAVMIETIKGTGLPFGLVEYEKSEYEKVDKKSLENGL